MSEYQYYEFQAIDRILTDDEQQVISTISSRVQLTRHRAIFTYSYGDFRGNPEQVLAQYFDAMFYMANWGSTQLMFRFPKSLINLKQIQPYCFEDYVSCSTAGEYVVLNIKFYEEEGRGWIEGEGWLDALIPLREDILKQDYRLLYLAWLKAISIVYPEELDESCDEPPVPSGLQQLSKPLKTFLDLFEVDDVLVDVASEVSAKQQTVPEDSLYEAIKDLSRDECDTFLKQVLQGTPNLAIELTRRLSELVAQEQRMPSHAELDRRTIGELLEAAEQNREQRRKRQAKEAAARQKKEMEELSREEPQLWQSAAELIAQKQVKAYENAIQILLKLQKLAIYQGQELSFQERINQIHTTYPRLSGLRSRMESAGLISK